MRDRAIIVDEMVVSKDYTIVCFRVLECHKCDVPRMSLSHNVTLILTLLIRVDSSNLHREIENIIKIKNTVYTPIYRSKSWSFIFLCPSSIHDSLYLFHAVTRSLRKSKET